MKLGLFVAIAFLGALIPDAASGARNPTAGERAGIQQAIFDHFTKAQPTHPVITGIKLSTKVAGGSLTNYYRKFARVNLFDAGGAGGPAYALLGYYVTRLSGWRMLSLGSAAVGCEVAPKIFRGRKRAILHDLKMGCP